VGSVSLTLVSAGAVIKDFWRSKQLALLFCSLKAISTFGLQADLVDESSYIVYW